MAEVWVGVSGWRYRELAASHLAALTRPREVADLLLETV